MKKNKNGTATDTVRKIKRTAQDTIPFAEIYENGLILNKRVKGKETYSLTFSISNINYLMQKETDKKKKLEQYMLTLNSLPQDITYQELCLNVPMDTTDLENTVIGNVSPAKTLYDKTYYENQKYFVKNIRNKKTETKLFVTLSYTAGSKTENPYNILMQNYSKISSSFAEFGSHTELLNAEERLQLFHALYNPFQTEEFNLPEEMYLKGQSIQDMIAPAGFSFKPNKFILGNETYCRCFFIHSFSETIDDEFISALYDSDYRIAISKVINPIDKGIAEKLVSNRLRKLEGTKQLRLQRNAKNNTNYVPYDLQKNISACEQLLDNLNHSEELFEVGIYIYLASESADALEDDTKALRGICQRFHVSISAVFIRQEDTLNSILPLASNDVGLNQYLLSSGVAHLLPFSYNRVFSPTGFYYGKNTISKSPIVINRKEDKNGNAFFFGKSGSGKSIYAKMEIEDIMHQTENDRIIIVDAEREFVEQTRQHGGTVIKIAADSENFINPFDAFGAYGETEDLIRTKGDLILSLFEIFKNAPLSAGERSIIDRCVQLSYKDFIRSGYKREKLPTFQTFDKILMLQEEKALCSDLHLYLDMYINGTVNIFAHRTNVPLDNRIIDFDLRDLGENLKKAGMLIIIDFIQQQVFKNFENGLWSWLYVDEFQTFYNDTNENNSAAVFFEKMFARFRKYGGLATGITQNITNVLKSQTAVSMMQNSQFVILLEQAKNNLEEITRIYDLSEGQSERLLNLKTGEGLLVSKNIVYPFEKRYPKDNIIYDTITTSFADKISKMERKTV